MGQCMGWELGGGTTVPSPTPECDFLKRWPSSSNQWHGRCGRRPNRRWANGARGKGAGDGGVRGTTVASPTDRRVVSSGADQVPEVGDVVGARGGPTGAGADALLEPDGRGGRPGTAVARLHASRREAVRREEAAAGGRWGEDADGGEEDGEVKMGRGGEDGEGRMGEGRWGWGGEDEGGRMEWGGEDGEGGVRRRRRGEDGEVKMRGGEDEEKKTTHIFGRYYYRVAAVDRNRRASPWRQALLLYLLQLVQALKYENFDEINAAYQRQVELNAATSRKGSMSSTTPTTPYADVDDAWWRDPSLWRSYRYQSSSNLSLIVIWANFAKMAAYFHFKWGCLHTFSR